MAWIVTRLPSKNYELRPLFFSSTICSSAFAWLAGPVKPRKEAS